MIVHVCDKCHEKMEDQIYVLRDWSFEVNGVIEYKLEYKEFCSLHCQEQYLIDGLNNLNLDKGIKG